MNIFDDLRIQKGARVEEIEKFLDLFAAVDAGPMDLKRMVRAEEKVNNLWKTLNAAEQDFILQKKIPDPRILAVLRLFGGRVVWWRFKADRSVKT